MATTHAAPRSKTNEGTTTKGRSRKAAAPPQAKPHAELVYYPGKAAVQAREADGHQRARTAQPAVLPSLEGPDNLIDAFLRERFLWLYDTEEGYGHVTYGALYDTDTSDVDSGNKAAHRATHVGRGKSRSDARRDLVCHFIGADKNLRRIYTKKQDSHADDHADEQAADSTK